VYPQKDLLPDAIADCEFEHSLIQPINGQDAAANPRSTIAFCQANAR